MLEAEADSSDDFFGAEEDNLAALMSQSESDTEQLFEEDLSESGLDALMLEAEADSSDEIVFNEFDQMEEKLEQLDNLVDSATKASFEEFKDLLDSTQEEEISLTEDELDLDDWEISKITNS